MSCTELLGPSFLAVIRIDGNNCGSSVGDTSLDYAKTDTASAEYGASGALFDFGSSCSSAETCGDSTTEKAGFVKRSFGIDGHNRYISDN